MRKARSEVPLTVVEQLRVLAGVGPEANRFDLRRGDLTIAVWYGGGSASALKLSIPYPTGSDEREAPAGYRRAASASVLAVPRPMRIHLRPETDADRRGKARDVAREVQTGSRDFDDAVYVDSMSADDVVASVLAPPAVRAAVLALIRDCADVRLDDDEGRVSISVAGFTERDADQRRGERLVHAVEQLGDALPAARRTGEAPSDPWQWAGVAACFAAALGLPGAALVYVEASPSRCVEHVGDGLSLTCSAGRDCCEPGMMGAGAGLGVGLVLAVAVRRVVRGRSSSHRTRPAVQIASVCLAIALGVVVARFV